MKMTMFFTVQIAEKRAPCSLLCTSYHMLSCFLSVAGQVYRPEL